MSHLDEHDIEPRLWLALNRLDALPRWRWLARALARARLDRLCKRFERERSQRC